MYTSIVEIVCIFSLEFGMDNNNKVLTCVLSSTARNMSKIFRITPSLGPIKTTRYVMPSSGSSTNNAFDAFRYCRVSAVFADLSFVINTL